MRICLAALIFLSWLPPPQSPVSSRAERLCFWPSFKIRRDNLGWLICIHPLCHSLYLIHIGTTWMFGHLFHINKRLLYYSSSVYIVICWKKAYIFFDPLIYHKWAISIYCLHSNYMLKVMQVPRVTIIDVHFFCPMELAKKLTRQIMINLHSHDMSDLVTPPIHSVMDCK